MSVGEGCAPFVEDGGRVVPAKGLYWMEARQPFVPRNPANGLWWFEEGQGQAHMSFRGLLARGSELDRSGATSVSSSGCRVAFAVEAGDERRLLVVEHC